MASGSRAHYRRTCMPIVSGIPTPSSGAAVYVYLTGTTTQIGQSIFAGFTGAGTLTQPLATDANGVVEFWLDQLETVDLNFSGGSPSVPSTTLQYGGEPYTSGP